MKRIFTAISLAAVLIVAASSCTGGKPAVEKAALSEKICHGDGETHCLELEVSVQIPTGRKVSDAARSTVDWYIWDIACLEGAPKEGMTAREMADTIAAACRDEYRSGEVYQDDNDFERRIFFTCGEVWKGILCYGYGTYIYIGGAHGGWVESYINVDLESGKKMELTDFVPESSFEALDGLLTGHLGDLDEDVRESLWEESVTHSEVFSVGEAGLTFHYGEYELGPYYIGTIDLTVPWDELESI